MLESNDRVAGQVADVGNTGFPPGLHDHPANVGPEQTVVGSVGVEVGIGVPVVGTVTSRPPLDGALDGTSTGHGEEVFKRLGRIVGTMRPETMVSRSDSQSDLEGESGVRQYSIVAFPRHQQGRRGKHSRWGRWRVIGTRRKLRLAGLPPPQSNRTTEGKARDVKIRRAALTQ